MSSLVRVVVLIIALLSVTVAYDIAECNKSKLPAVLEPLKSNSNYPMCRTELQSSTQPCSVGACRSLVAPMIALSLPNCTVKQPSFDYIPASLQWRGSAVCKKTEDPLLKLSHLFYERVIKDLFTSM